VRNQYLLLVVFLGLGVLSVVKAVADRKDYVSIESIPRMFPGFTADNVSKIVISKPKGEAKVPGSEEEIPRESLAFVRQEGKWILGSGNFAGIPARESEIKSRILEKIPEIEISTSSLIVEKADDIKLKDFELDEASAALIECYGADGGMLAGLYIGRTAGGADLGEKSADGVFVRKKGDKLVVRFEDRFDLDLDPQSWIDKSMLDLPEADIREITLRNEKGEIQFKREEGKGWKAVKGKPKDMGKLREFEVTALLGRARSVYAQDFIAINDPKLWPRFGLEPPKIEVLVKTKDGKVHGLRIGKMVEGKQEYHAVIAEGRLIFTMPDWDVTAFEKDPKDFFDPASAKEEGDSKKESSDGAGKKDGGDKDGEAAEVGGPGKGETGKNEVDAATKEGAGKAATPGSGKPTTRPAGGGK